MSVQVDKQLIESLGGPAKVAELLRYDKYGGVQRAFNWMHRGIPARVRLEHPEIFPVNKKLSVTEEPQSTSTGV